MALTSKMTMLMNVLHIKNLTYDHRERPYIKIDTLFCTNIGSLYTADDGVF